jgi:hypothetical protein
VNPRYHHLNTTYVRRSKAHVLARGACVTCFEPREAERAGKTRCAACAAIDALKQRARNEARAA